MYYTLKDISTYGLIRRGVYYQDCAKYFNHNATALLQYKIRDYNELEQAILSGNPNFQSEFFYNEIQNAKEKLASLNLKDLEDARFKFDTYRDSGYQEAVLNSSEEKINGSNILVSSPLALQRSTTDRLKEFNVAQIKSLLEKVSFTGRNALTYYLCSFGDTKTFRVIEAIRFLEEQMLRIAASIPDYMDQSDLFRVDAKIKREMIRDDLERIITEFLSGNDAYIFGALTDRAKAKIQEAVLKPLNAWDAKIQNRIINMLADYTIREELEPGIKRVRAMERFH